MDPPYAERHETCTADDQNFSLGDFIFGGARTLSSFLPNIYSDFAPKQILCRKRLKLLQSLQIEPVHFDTDCFSILVEISSGRDQFTRISRTNLNRVVLEIKYL